MHGDELELSFYLISERCNYYVADSPQRKEAFRRLSARKGQAGGGELARPRKSIQDLPYSASERASKRGCGGGGGENVSGNKEITGTKQRSTSVGRVGVGTPRRRPPYSHLALPLLEANPPCSLALSGYRANLSLPSAPISLAFLGFTFAFVCCIGLRVF